MKASEFQSKTESELKDLLSERKKEAFNLRFQQANGQLENTARVRQVRRDIARVKTVLSQQASGTVAAKVKKAAPKKKAVGKKKSAA